MEITTGSSSADTAGEETVTHTDITNEDKEGETADITKCIMYTYTIQLTFLMTMAVAPPPPLQIVATPYLPL